MGFINYEISHSRHVLRKREEKICAKTQCWLYNLKRMTHVDMCILLFSFQKKEEYLLNRGQVGRERQLAG